VPSDYQNYFFQPSKVDGFLFGVVTDEGVFVFYVDKSLCLVSAANKLKGKEAAAVSDDAQAKRTLALVLDRWAQVVDGEEAKKPEPSQ